MEFQVCRRGREARWVVTLGKTVYGAYLDKEQALLDAVDAARDALAAGTRLRSGSRSGRGQRASSKTAGASEAQSAQFNAASISAVTKVMPPSVR